MQNIFRKETGLKRYALNTSWLLGARAIQMAVALVIGAMVARYLGPQQYGIYNYVISFVGIFSVLSALGTNNILVKDLLLAPDREMALLGTGLTIRLAGSIFASLLILIISFFTEEDQTIRWFLFLASLQTVVKSFEVLNLYFQAKVVSKFTVAAQLISLTIISLLKVFFIFNRYPLQYFIYLFIIDSAIVSAALILFYKRLGKNILHWKYSISISKSLLQRSWPLLFSGMLTTIYLKIDQVMLQHMLDETAVGLYAAAVKISEAWITIPWILSGSLFPALVNAQKEDTVLFRNRISQMYILLVSVALSVIIPVCVFSESIIHFIFGDAYNGSFTTLQIHIFSSIFIFYGSISNRWLILENLQKYWMINSAIGAVTNILFN
ncbi:MAG: flippase, partial [Chitinophagales bacterium]